MRFLSKINGRKVGKPEWIVLVLLLCLPFFTECFYDLLATYAHGYAFLKAICNFDFLKGYEYSHEFIRGNGLDSTLQEMEAAYPVTIYLIFAVWSIPIAIIRKIWETGIFAPGIILWYKLLLVITSILCYKKFDSILKIADMPEERKGWSAFIFFSSLLFAMPTMAMSQYDIFTVFFILWGVELYIKNSKDYKWIALFGVAATFKSFAFLIFIPMLLLKEKRLLKIVVNALLALLPTLLCSLLFVGSEIYKETTSWFYASFAKRLFESVIAGGNAPIVLFIGGMIALFIWSYVSPCKDTARETLANVAWAGTVAFSLMLLFVYCHPQWCLLLLPFVVLLISLNEGKTKINVILMYFAEVALTFYYILHFGWVYCTNISMSFTLIKCLGIHSDKSGNLADAFHGVFGFTFDSTIFTIFAIAILGLIILNYPKSADKEKEDSKFLAENDYGMIIVRLGTILVIWLVDLFINLGLLF